MIFSGIKTTFESQARKIKGGENIGELISLSFLIQPSKTVQRIKFEKYEGDSELTKEERDKFAKMLSLDIDKEMTFCSSIFVIANMVKKTLTIQKNLYNNEKEIINL